MLVESESKARRQIEAQLEALSYVGKLTCSPKCVSAALVEGRSSDLSQIAAWRDQIKACCHALLNKNFAPPRSVQRLVIMGAALLAAMPS